MAKNTEKNARDYNIEARKRYRRDRSKTVNVLFNLETEKGLLEHLEKQSNKSGYLKHLIAEDMKK